MIGNASKGLRRFIAFFLTICLFCTAAAAAIWYESYGKAKDAIDAGRWREAISYLDQAIELKPGSHFKARTYGINFENYFPYLKLGIAYYHLGQLDAASKALDTEEQFKAVANSESDLKDLREYRVLIRQAREDSAAEARTKIENLVSESLEQAGRHEADGQLDAALKEVGKALAVAPNDQNAKNALTRLQAKVASLSRRREREARVETLVKEGEAYLVAAQFEAASGKFAEALSLQKDDRVQRFFDSAQTKLRERQIGAELKAESIQKAVSAALEKAGDLESRGMFKDALTGLQPALAIDPANQGLLDIQTRLLARIERDSEDRHRNERVAFLLSDAQRFFAGGSWDDSLASANQALALDPESQEAQQYVGKTYRALSQQLLGKESLSPRIFWIDKQNHDLGQGYSAQKIRQSSYSLSGMVYHETPAEIKIRLDHYRSSEDLIGENRAGEGSEKEKQREIEAEITQDKVGEESITIFEVTPELESGLSALTIIAYEPLASRERTSRYLVFYDPPFYSTTWFSIASPALALAALAMGYGLRQRRRRLALKRRFNPYVAGSPVLQDDLFFGREQLLQNILQSIHNNSIMLFGERRIGKTSLQHHLKKRLGKIDDPEYAFYGIFIDLQGVPQERFFITLRDEIYHELATVLEGDPSPKAQASAREYDYRDLVVDLVRILGILAGRTSKKVRLVLLIDEVDQLNTYDPKVNQRLRSLFMRNFSENIVAVVSGVSIRKHWDGEGSPWYNFFEEIEVKPFLEKDAEMLIEKPIRGIIKLEKGAASRIIEVTRCRPYLIQKLCVELVNRMYEEGRRTITLADVEAMGIPAES
jgi:tetratricopeptide (TPR) repeat protein